MPYSKCSNPLGLKRHKKVARGTKLYAVTAEYAQKHPDLHLSEGDQLCGGCKVAIGKSAYNRDNATLSNGKLYYVIFHLKYTNTQIYLYLAEQSTSDSSPEQVQKKLKVCVDFSSSASSDIEDDNSKDSDYTDILSDVEG